MTPKSLDASARVAYHRDAKIFPSLEAQILKLSDAVQVAIDSHRPDEYPVIIGSKLQLIGIEAIRAARDAIEKKMA